MSDASDFDEREQVQDCHESPDAPANNVRLAVAALRLHVVKDVPSTMKQCCSHPKDPWEMLHCFLLYCECRSGRFSYDFIFETPDIHTVNNLLCVGALSDQVQSKEMEEEFVSFDYFFDMDDEVVSI